MTNQLKSFKDVEDVYCLKWPLYFIKHFPALSQGHVGFKVFYVNQKRDE